MTGGRPQFGRCRDPLWDHSERERCAAALAVGVAPHPGQVPPGEREVVLPAQVKTRRLLGREQSREEGIRLPAGQGGVAGYRDKLALYPDLRGYAHGEDQVGPARTPQNVEQPIHLTADRRPIVHRTPPPVPAPASLVR